MRKSTRRKIRNIVFIAVNVGIVAGLAIAEFTHTEGTVMKVHFRMRYLLCALACFVVAMTCETLKYYRMMKHVRGDATVWNAFEIAALGKYYDNITPLGAGGQPFQAISLHERGYDTGASTSMPIAGFFTLQIAFSVLALMTFIFAGRYMPLPGIRAAAYVGLLFYLFVPMLILVFTLIPSSFEKLMGVAIRVGSKVRLVRDPETTIRKAEEWFGGYRSSLEMLWRAPRLQISALLLSALYQIAICSMPYFVLHAFGSNSRYLETFAVTVFIYAAITFIPTPGNAGAAEGTFYLIFSSLSGGHLFWAMITWRFFCYYLFLIVGLVLQARQLIAGKRQNLENAPKAELKNG